MAKLKVVALISGGKDSFFSIIHCIAQGHDVIALANLHPVIAAGDGEEDIDSFMYQTIGHSIVPLYEQALQLPLYRRVILGIARVTSKTYHASTDLNTEPDETESLIPLLQQVMEAHPEVNAVSSGAILSDYQRTRVESVAVRLGLTPIAYLWQYPRIVTNSPTAMLEDMARVGQDARMIKVASGGLDESFLWSNVADQKTITRLVKAAMRFGDLDRGAALGEGGEYETLVIDGPAPLWKGRLVIRDQDVHIVPGEAGSASVRVSAAEVCEKTEASSPETVRSPALLDALFSDLLQALELEAVPAQGCSPAQQSNLGDAVDLVPDVLIPDVTASGSDVAQQTEAIMSSIKALLHEAGHSMDDIAYTSIILRDISDFVEVNAAYKTAFTRPNPPARMTLACAAVLPEDSLVSISVSSRKLDQPAQRQGLHVQSLSCWAPANIGPYSQAISLPSKKVEKSSIVYIAGQIPLVPATLELHNPANNTFLQQAVLSLQHLYRIGQALSVEKWVHAIAFVTAAEHHEAVRRATLVRTIWRSAHSTDSGVVPDVDVEEDDESFDVWHRRYGGQQHSLAMPLSGDSQAMTPSKIWIGSPPSLQVFKVDALPRQASVEWVAFGTDSQEPVLAAVPHYLHLLKLFADQAI